jgi:hypothetical protein
MSRGWPSPQTARTFICPFFISSGHRFHANKSADKLGASLLCGTVHARARFELWLFVTRFALLQPPSPSESASCGLVLAASDVTLHAVFEHRIKLSKSIFTLELLALSHHLGSWG